MVSGEFLGTGRSSVTRPDGFLLGRGPEAGLGAGGRPEGTALADRGTDMASSRVPQQLFLQGVAAVYLFAFASLYTQIPGEGVGG